MLKTHSFH